MSIELTAEQVEAQNKKLRSVAGTILNKTDEEIASLYLNEDGVVNENFESDLSKIHSDNIQEIRDLNKTRFDDGYKKANSEVLSKAESDINTHFKFEGSGSLVERVSEIIRIERENAVKGVGDKVVTEADVKKHPLYTGLQDGYDELKTDSEKQLNQYKSQVEADKVQSQVIGMVTVEVEKLKPIFNKDTNIAANQKADIIAKVASGSWGIVEGVLTPFDKDGVPARSKHNHPLKTADLIKAQVESFYDLNQGGKGGAPAGGGGTQDGPEGDIKSIDNSKDFKKAFQGAAQAINDARKIVNKEDREEAVKKAQKRWSDLRAHGKGMNF